MHEGTQTGSRKAGRVRSSCAECRRSKLRCDKIVPCGKCVSRGCTSICPNAPGKGNRFILANTEELHARIERLNIRVCELENALRTLQASISKEPHPLLLHTKDVSQDKVPFRPPLTPNLPTHPENSPQLSVESVAEPHPSTVEDDGFVDAFGTLTLGRRGESSFFGHTARGEYLFNAATLQVETDVSSSKMEENHGIMSIMAAHLRDEDVRQEVYSRLPAVSEAIRLCENYQTHAKYLFLPISRIELFDEILVHVYEADFDVAQSSDALALLFVILALGVYYDLDRERYYEEAQEYFHLARTAVGFISQTTRLSIEALLHIAQYLLYSDWDTTNSTSAWMYIGHATRLGHSIGLHLNSGRWKLPEEDTQRRCRTFWQCFVLDTWTSFHFGRPPIMSTSYIDCPIPPDPDETVDEDGQKHIGFYAWIVRIAALAHSVMDTAFGAKPPAYSVIGSLDRKIRDSPFPPYCGPLLDGTECPPGSVSFEVNIQRWLVLCRRETTLLHLHRVYFFQTIQEQPADLAKHRYAPSVVAVYRSAWRLIEGLRVIWSAAPQWLGRHAQAWSHGLSAAIVLCQLVTRAPTSSMTPPAVAQLDVVWRIFQDAALSAPVAAHFLDIIFHLHRKAHEMVDHLASHAVLSFTPSDLDCLSGKTHLVADIGKSQPEPPACAAQTPIFTNTHSLGRGGVEPNVSIAENMHPTIAQDMMDFDMGSLTFNDFSDDVLTASALSSIQLPGWGGIDNSFSPVGNYYTMGGLPLGNGYETYDKHIPILNMSWQHVAEQFGFESTGDNN